MSGTEITCSRKVKIVADTTIKAVLDTLFDVVVLPGGLGGAQALSDSLEVGGILKHHEKEKKYIAAICAAPTALLSHKIGLGKKITSYPSFKDQLSSSYKYVEKKSVVQDGLLITSRGPGTAFTFALRLAKVLVGDVETRKVAGGMLL